MILSLVVGNYILRVKEKLSVYLFLHLQIALNFKPSPLRYIFSHQFDKKMRIEAYLVMCIPDHNNWPSIMF